MLEAVDNTAWREAGSPTEATEATNCLWMTISFGLMEMIVRPRILRR